MGHADVGLKKYHQTEVQKRIWHYANFHTIMKVLLWYVLEERIPLHPGYNCIDPKYTI